GAMVALGSLRADEADVDAGQGEGRGGLAGMVRVTAATGTVVCTRCEVARRPHRRLKGLLGRRGLRPGHGMLVTRASFVLTLFMRFAIDVVFLDRDSRVVGIAHALRPWRAAGAVRAVAVLKLPAGAA